MAMMLNPASPTSTVEPATRRSWTTRSAMALAKVAASRDSPTGISTRSGLKYMTIRSTWMM
jgi:hypothetical protein